MSVSKISQARRLTSLVFVLNIYMYYLNQTFVVQLCLFSNELLLNK